MNSKTRIISRALVASLLVFIAACYDSGDGVLYNGDLPSAPDASPPTPEPSPGNMVEAATAAGSFPTLLAAVEAAGLVDALSDDGASLTCLHRPKKRLQRYLPARSIRCWQTQKRRLKS